MEKPKNQRKMNSSLAPPTCIQPRVIPEPGKAGVYTNQLHFIQKQVLEQLPKVDTKEMNLPNYYHVIRRPMDVGTIAQRVENNYYRSVDEAIEDFRQIYRNCYKFHSPGTSIYRKGVQLQKFFDRTIAKLPKGPPVPCNKKPKKLVNKPDDRPNPMTEAQEQVCRDHLRSLAAISNKFDATLRNYFNGQWSLLSQQLDEHLIQSPEDLNLRVIRMTGNYFAEAHVLFYRVFGRPLNDGNYDNSIANQMLNATIRKISDGLDEMKLLMEYYNEHPPMDQASGEVYRANMSKVQDKVKDFNAVLSMQLALRNIPIPDPVPNEMEVNAVDLISPDTLAFLLDTTLDFDIIGGNN